MAQVCNHCGKSFESTASICPYCQVDQPAPLPASGAPAVADDAYNEGDGEAVQIVTAPVRKKRSLPVSCFIGILIFTPTILLVAFLMLFYFKQNSVREKQELKRVPVVDRENTEKILSKLSDGMETLVLNARPDLIVSIRAKSQELLLITVKPEWDNLPEITQTDLQKRWLSKWQQLDGKSVEIEVAATESKHSSVEGQ